MTKQDLKNPQRKLTLSDLNYFYEKYFPHATMVHREHARKFFDWFLPCMQQVRFKKHVKTMWLLGLVFGFIDKVRNEVSVVCYINV